MVKEYRVVVTKATQPGQFPMAAASTNYGEQLAEYRRLQAEHPDWHLELEYREIGVWRVVDED